MTDLHLSEESKEYQNLARDFFQNEVANKSEKLDHEGKFPMELYKAAWDLGLATTFIPERLGGLGLPLWDSVVMAEEAGAASGGVATIFEGNTLAAAPLLVAGSEAQQEEYLGQLAAEATLAGYCFASIANGSSFPLPAASFSKNGNKFVLRGKNIATINGEHASWYFVLAQNEDNNECNAFVFSASLPGIKRGAQIFKLGRRASDICSVDFDNVDLSESNLVGQAAEGQLLMQESACISAPIVAAHAAGLMQCALDHSVRYSKERVTFGKPLSKHQGVQFMLADMARAVQAARLLSWKTAYLYDHGTRDFAGAIGARAFAVDAAMNIATDAVQIYGGYGYSKEYPVERLMRDAKMMQMMSGTTYEIKCAIGEELLAV